MKERGIMIIYGKRFFKQHNLGLLRSYGFSRRVTSTTPSRPLLSHLCFAPLFRLTYRCVNKTTFLQHSGVTGALFGAIREQRNHEFRN
jgi:hypothetical protein